MRNKQLLEQYFMNLKKRPVQHIERPQSSYSTDTTVVNYKDQCVQSKAQMSVKMKRSYLEDVSDEEPRVKPQGRKFRSIHVRFLDEK